MTEGSETRERKPITFAAGGASVHEPAHTIEAFEKARRLGATGLHSTVWLTQDDVPVLLERSAVGRRPFRRDIRTMTADALPPQVLLLRDLYAAIGAGVDISLEVSVPHAFSAVMETARRYQQDSGTRVVDKLWLNHSDWHALARWRESDQEVRLVDKSRRLQMIDGPERRAAQLADAGIDTVNMHYGDWTGGLVVLFRRFGVRSFGWDAQHKRMVDELVNMDIDGIYSEHFERSF